MPTKYGNLLNNVRDISRNCPGFGDYYTLLGRKGYCFGLVMMWGQAVLCNDEATFFRRLDLLTTEYPPGDRLSDRINNINDIYRYRCRYNPTGLDNIYFQACMSKYPYTLLRSIRAFLDGLLMYHKPKATSIYTDSKYTRLKFQSALFSSRYVANSEIERFTRPQYTESGSGITYVENEPLNKIFYAYFSCCGNYIADIFEVIQSCCKDIAEPFFFHLGSCHHAIGLKFDKGYLKFFDPNHLSRSERFDPNKSFNNDACIETFPMGKVNRDDINQYLLKHFIVKHGKTKDEIEKAVSNFRLKIVIYAKPGPQYAELGFIIENKIYNGLSKFFIGRIIFELNDYISKLGFFMPMHTHRQRAAFAIKELQKITTIADLGRWLGNEYSLIAGITGNEIPDGYAHQHYGTGKLSKNRDMEEPYLKIIQYWNGRFSER